MEQQTHLHGRTRRRRPDCALLATTITCASYLRLWHSTSTHLILSGPSFPHLQVSHPATRLAPSTPSLPYAPPSSHIQTIYTPHDCARYLSDFNPRSRLIRDGMPVETERELRRKGFNFILQVHMMLKLPQITLRTAAVFINRYSMRNSPKIRQGYKQLHRYI